MIFALAGIEIVLFVVGSVVFASALYDLLGAWPNIPWGKLVVALLGLTLVGGAYTPARLLLAHHAAWLLALVILVNLVALGLELYGYTEQLREARKHQGMPLQWRKRY